MFLNKIIYILKTKNKIYLIFPIKDREFLLKDCNLEYDFIQKIHNLFEFKQLMTDFPLKTILI